MREKENQPDTDTLTQDDALEKQIEKTAEQIESEIQETCETIKKKIVDEKITDKIKKIQTAFDYFAADVFRWYNFNYQFTSNDVKLMCNTVVFYILQLWLENDTSSTQTIGSFAKQPYTPVPEQKRKMPERNKEKANIIRYYEKFYRDNLILAGQQAKKEGFKFKRPNYKQKYDFLSLRSMEMMNENYYDIYNLLFRKKKLLQISTRGKDDGLVNAFKKYGEIIDNLNKCTSEKEFVIGCFEFVKFENSYRVILAGKIAQYMIREGVSPEDELPEILEILYYRLPPRLPLSNSSMHTTLICKYSIIEDAFKREAANIGLEKIFAMRIVVEEVTCMISVLFPTKKFGMWRDEDYKRAAEFLTDEFDVLQIYDDFEFDKLNVKDTEFCKCVRNLYSNDSFMDQEMLEIGRKILGRKHKKKNKKVKKKNKKIKKEKR